MKLNSLQKSKKEKENSLAYAPTKKKISFFSAILVVIGSCVGSGIFFKSGAVLEGSGNNIIFAMFTWIFASFAVLCLALALIDITSVRNDNLSIIGWTKTFNSKFIYKSCKNFIFFIYSTIKYFFMPLYCAQAFQDGIAALYINSGHSYNGFGTNADWAILMLIAVVMAIYFIVVCGLSSKMGDVQNILISIVKFLPLILAGVIGFVIIGMNGGHIAGEYITDGFKSYSDDLVKQWTFKTYTPGFGLFIASIGIFYAYDGFYNAAGIQSELKEPKKLPSIILVGLIATTAIYLIIAISMSLGSTGGNPQGLVSWFAEHNALIVFAIFEILIGIGIFSVLNGFALWTPRYTEDLILEGELPFAKKFAHKIDKSRKVGVVYNLVTVVPTVIVLCIIGGLFYINSYDSSGIAFATSQQLVPIFGQNADFSQMFGTDYVNNVVYYHYGSGVGSLYTFADVISNWSALFVFLFLVCTIIGGIKNKKTQKVKIKYSKFFTPFAYLSVILISVCIFMGFIEPFVNLIFLAKIVPNYTGDNLNEIIISRVMTIVMLIIYLSIIILPSLIDNYLLKKKYGSIENGELQKVNEIRKSLNLPLAKSYDELEKQELIGTIGNSLTDEIEHIK